MGRPGLVASKIGEQQPFLGYHLLQARNYRDATVAPIDAEVWQNLKSVCSARLTRWRTQWS